eukprot:2645044-Pleurochrysis_carterae.AAC.1
MIDTDGIKGKWAILSDSSSDVSSCRWRIPASANLAVLANLVSMGQHSAIPVESSSQSVS